MEEQKVVQVKNQRESKYDLLRIVCTIMVIALHWGGQYGTIVYPHYPFYYFTVGSFFFTAFRICIPIFVMLSGAFLLGEKKNRDYGYFYKKSWKKLGIPTIIFSIFYILFAIGIEILSKRTGNKVGVVELKPIFDELVNGKPYYHLWYMFMLPGLYLLTPIFIRVKEEVKKKSFIILGIILLLSQILLIRTSSLFWPYSFLEYIGYFVIGNIIKESTNTKKFKPFLGILGSVFLMCGVFIIRQMQVEKGMFPNVNVLSYNYYITMISAILLFVSFRNMKIKSNAIISHFSGNAFYIYLFHGGLIILIVKITNILSLSLNPVWYIPVATIIVLLLSDVCTVIYKRILTVFRR